ncbi:c-type cytochrome biogenesis protein CcsB [bacterium]|nr:c-type cytochrome biogenesis protein CcsB [candidate division CSSED10-310 bacterium]
MWNESLLVNTGVALYTAAFAHSLFRIVLKKSTGLWLNTLILVMGWLFHSSAIGFRWYKTYSLGYGYFPVTDRYESLIFFGWCMALGWLLVRQWIRGPVFSASMQFLAAALTASAGLFSEGMNAIDPLMPALRSNWLVFHVVTCFLAYAAFAASAFIAVQFIFRSSRARMDSRDIIRVDQIMYRIVSVGFFLLTLGILSGSAWAQQSWGRYWGWDPKEVWSLITWLVYAVFLHARITHGLSGRKLAFIVILGFLAVLFTFFGVNYLPVMSGLHSYA